MLAATIFFLAALLFICWACFKKEFKSKNTRPVLGVFAILILSIFFAGNLLLQKTLNFYQRAYLETGATNIRYLDTLLVIDKYSTPMLRKFPFDLLVSANRKDLELFQDTWLKKYPATMKENIVSFLSNRLKQKADIVNSCPMTSEMENNIRDRLTPALDSAGLELSFLRVYPPL